MRSLACIAAGLLIALAHGPATRADDDAKKIIDQAVEAHGGAKKLAEFKDKSVIQKAKMIIASQNNLEAKMEVTAGGKKFKQVIELTIMGMDIVQTTAYDGKELWIAINGKVQITLTKEDELKAIKEALHAEEVAGLALLGDKSLEYSIIGEDKVNDAPVIGIRVSKKDHKDVNLFFDKKTHLLLKVENRGLDFQTQMEVSQERILSDYKDQDGLKRANRVIVNQDGKKVVEIEFTEIKLLDKLDANAFDKP